ncbi:MAG: MBL fold metallo-hydrolase [Candidatus Lloydbacteria bacterium]|nr:MBL fold metallo-hydrolase [Candidatus Lloydbacteria bacterium]
MLKEKKLDLGEYHSFLLGSGIGKWKWEHPFPLQSDPGVLQICFLGCGSAFSTRQFQSNLIVSKGNTSVFVDLGSKATVKMLEFGLSVNDIKHLIVTHSHADHIGSLEELALKARYEAPVKKAIEDGYKPGTLGFLERVNEIKAGKEMLPSLHIPHEYAKALWEKSLVGGMGYSETMTSGGPTQSMGLDHFLRLTPPRKIFNEKYGRDVWGCTIGEDENAIHFLLYRTKHIPDMARNLEENFFSCGLIIDRKVMISGDTQFDAEVFMKIGNECETIFHDCQSFPGGVHAYYGELRGLPREIKRKIYLYHCDDGMRPLNPDGTLGGDERVLSDGFAGFAKPMPYIYE